MSVGALGWPGKEDCLKPQKNAINLVKQNLSIWTDTDIFFPFSVPLELKYVPFHPAKNFPVVQRLRVI